MSSTHFLIKIINLSKNYGQNEAYLVGFSNSNADAIITMDTDMQHPISIIPKMIKLWEKGSKIVLGIPKNRNDNFIKKYTAKFFYKIVKKLFVKDYPEFANDFRLIDKSVKNKILNYKNNTLFIRGFVLSLVSIVAKYKINIIKYNYVDRQEGKSHWSIFKMLQFGINGIIFFSNNFMKFIIFITLFIFTFLVIQPNNIIIIILLILCKLFTLSILILFIKSLIKQKVKKKIKIKSIL